MNKFTHNYCVVKLGIVLHLYQPYAQIESVFKRITTECYIPLINYIKSTKTRLTLNIPLSTLEQFEKYGYSGVLKDLKNLYDEEIIELTGTGAYHPLLTRIPLDYAENQILLQEYGLGYFFGSHNTQDDVSMAQLKDISGFFPPELAFNATLVPVLEAMGYNWVLIEDIATENNSSKSGTFLKLKDFNITFVRRNSFLSNLISFKRDINISDISGYVISTLSNAVSQTLVTGFDAEYLGHHYKDGLTTFDALLRTLNQKGVFITRVCDLLPSITPDVQDRILDCTWGASAEDLRNKNPYPFWYIHDNVIHSMLADLDFTLIKYVSSTLGGVSSNIT